MALRRLATRARWPRTLTEVGHVAVSAWLVHGAYLGGVFVALAGGMPAGTIAMLVGLQPILTVLLARRWLGRARRRRGSGPGLLLGLAGVWLVVRHKVGTVGDAARTCGRPPSRWWGSASARSTRSDICAHVDLRAAR